MRSFNKPMQIGAALGGIAILAGLCGCNIVGNEPARRASSAPAAASLVVPDGPTRVGEPYQLGGETWTPADVSDYDEVGYASWYGGELELAATASGEPFRASWVSAAHRTLPLPSYVEVTRLDTGKTILVRINDRGPADPRRLIDLSAAAAEQLGIAEQGMVQVRVRRTNPVETERLALRSGGVVPARLDTPESLLTILRERAARLPVPTGASPANVAAAAPAPAPAPAPVAVAPSNPAAIAAPAPAAASGRYMVQVATFSSRARATALAQRLGATVVSAGNLHRVRLGPFADEAAARAEIARVRTLGQPGAVIQRSR